MFFAPTAKTVGLLNDMRRKWPSRIEQAKRLFLLDVAGFLVREVQKRAPKLKLGGTEFDYASQLKIALLEEGDGEDSVAIYLDGRTVELDLAGAESAVLYFRAVASSPEWVGVLERHGPWPARSVPVPVGPKDAKIIARKGRRDEIVELDERHERMGPQIYAELREAGAGGVSGGLLNGGVGMVVHEDLGFSVMRRELGLDGEDQVAHWRPAFRATKKYAAKSMEKVVEFIRTGNINVFSVPEHEDSAPAHALKQGEGFAKEISPFV